MSNKSDVPAIPPEHESDNRGITVGAPTTTGNEVGAQGVTINQMDTIDGGEACSDLRAALRALR
jgi:hypothetical protein